MANGTQRNLPSSVAPGVTTESRPIPDPTVLTTQQIYNAVASLRDVMDVRLCAMDKAVQLLQETANRKPTIGEVEGVHRTKIENLEKRVDHKYVETAADLSHLRDIHGARMDGIENLFKTQFEEREKRNRQMAEASTAAIGAALQAQRDAAFETQRSSGAAITKAEIATNDTLRQLQALFQTSINALNTQVQDLKSRIDRGEAGDVGKREATGDSRTQQLDARSLIFSVIAALLAGGAFMVALLNYVRVIH